MKIPDKVYIYLSIALLLIAVSQGKTLSQFLLDDEEPAAVQSGPEEVKEPENTKDLPVHVARDIRAELVPDIRGAIKITWNVHGDSKEDYIVGRAYDVPDTAEKALKAVSIKVVPAGANTEVIDTKLEPGNYYYCVLSKSKIVNNDIELYPNMNYTVSPVVMEEKDVKPARGAPPQVSLIYARKMNRNRVLITWRGIDAYNIIYTVYRGETALDSPEKLKRAVIIAEITDSRESYVDRSITSSGVYFYAVTTKDIMGNEDLGLMPDQSYTTNGIFIDMGSLGTVTNIKAFAIQNNGIKITWRPTGSGISGFVIYRYLKPISDADRLALAVFVDKVRKDQTFYIDKNPGFENTYYAVLANLTTGKVNDNLIMDQNYTSAPVSTGKSIRIQSVSAEKKDANVEIVWKFEGSTGDRNYKVVRSSGKIGSPGDVEKGVVIEFVNVFDQRCIDKNPPPGLYYYCIVPEKADEGEYEIEEGVNVISEPVEIEEKKPERPVEPPPKPPVIVAEPEPEKPLKIEEPAVEKKPAGQISELDRILINHFFKEDYKTSIKKLNEFIEKSEDARATAKARLFMGRSLLELGKYREALDYLILADVREHFPDEAVFWTQYVLARLR